MVDITDQPCGCVECLQNPFLHSVDTHPLFLVAGGSLCHFTSKLTVECIAACLSGHLCFHSFIQDFQFGGGGGGGG